ASLYSSSVTFSISAIAASNASKEREQTWVRVSALVSNWPVARQFPIAAEPVWAPLLILAEILEEEAIDVSLEDAEARPVAIEDGALEAAERSERDTEREREKRKNVKETMTEAEDANAS